MSCRLLGVTAFVAALILSAVLAAPSSHPEPRVSFARDLPVFAVFPSESVPPVTTTTIVETPPEPARSAAPRVASGSCEGFVIPGDIVWRESHCDYGAYNPTGCSGYGCWGAYQISGEWYLPGRPCEGLSQSPADQDECARRIWRGGAGAGNWR